MAARLAELGSGPGGLRLSRLAAGGLAVAAVAGPLLLIISDFTTLFQVKAVTAVLKEVPGGVVSGGKNHSYAMLIIGLVAAPMSYGAVRGGSRAAMIALAVLGIAAAIIALAVDLPDATGTNTLAKTFAEAEGIPSIGFYLETLGAALTLVAGGGALMLAEDGQAPRSDDAQPPDGDGGRTSATNRDELARAQAAAARSAARLERRSPASPGTPPRRPPGDPPG